MTAGSRRMWHVRGTPGSWSVLIALVLVVFLDRRERATLPWGLILSPSATNRIKGAGNEDSPERPVLTVAEVYALADAVGLRYRSLVLLAAFSSLRWAELAALTPADIDWTREPSG